MSANGSVVAYDGSAFSGLNGIIRWNLQSLSKGVYYLKVESKKLNAESKATTVKFMKE